MNLLPKSYFLQIFEHCDVQLHTKMKLLLNNVGKGKLSEKKAFGFKMKKKAGAQQQHLTKFTKSIKCIAKFREMHCVLKMHFQSNSKHEEEKTQWGNFNQKV